MVINTGKEPEEAIEERVKKGIVQETDIYKYLGLVVNKLGNLKDRILESNRKCEVINGEITANGENARQEKKKLESSLNYTSLIPALLYVLEAWAKTGKDEMNEIEKIQERASKIMFNQPISTP